MRNRAAARFSDGGRQIGLPDAGGSRGRGGEFDLSDPLGIEIYWRNLNTDALGPAFDGEFKLSRGLRLQRNQLIGPLDSNGQVGGRLAEQVAPRHLDGRFLAGAEAGICGGRCDFDPGRNEGFDERGRFTQHFISTGQGDGEFIGAGLAVVSSREVELERPLLVGFRGGGHRGRGASVGSFDLDRQREAGGRCTLGITNQSRNVQRVAGAIDAAFGVKQDIIRSGMGPA